MASENQSSGVWTGALAPPDPGIVIYADLHRPPPDVSPPFTVVRDDRDAPESGVSIVSPLATVALNIDAIAREIVTAWWGWLMPWYANPGEGVAEATYLAARARLTEFCTAEERALLYRVSWDHILVMAQQMKRVARWYCDDALRGNYGPGDPGDGYVPKSKRLRRQIADLRDCLWAEIHGMGMALLDANDRRRRDLEALMREPPNNTTAARAHTKLDWVRPWRGER